MEIRLSLCLAFLLVAVISHSSEARHSLSRRQATDTDYVHDSDTELNDEGEDDEVPEVPATILSKPENYTVKVHKKVRLECSVDIPDAVVGWKKDSVSIIAAGIVVADGTKYEKDGTNLLVKNLAPSDAGIYECEVQQTNPVRIQHELIVLQKPTVESIDVTDDGRPQQGSDLTFTCHVSGNPAPSVVWSKEVDNNNTRLAEGPVYTIRNVKLEDSGKYLCYAITLETSDTKAVHVVVQGKPRMHVPRTVINSDIGVEAVLQCSVHEAEPVTITWYKGRELIDSSRYSTRGTHSNLTVTPQTDADFGAYTCKAECAVGTHHRTIELVQRPVVEELESDGQKLSWRVHSHQPLRSIQIQLLDTREDSSVYPIEVPIPEAKTHEYEMSYVVDSSSVKPGNYGVVIKVENSKGMSESSDQIIYEQVESEPVRASVSFLPGAAHVSRPTTALLSTVLMYLLVRMI